MRTVRFISTISLLVAPSLSFAQAPADSGFRAGQWGAEGSLAGSSLGTALLRFRSPTSAWVLGADLNVSRIENEFESQVGDLSDSYTLVNFSTRLGMRRYRQSDGDRLRPVVGGGLLGSIVRGSNDLEGWRAGAYGELGAMYFLASHVSLGATGELQASYGTDERDGPTGQSTKLTTTTFGASLVRVLVSVYF